MGLFSKSTDKCLEVLRDFHAAREKLEARMIEASSELARLRVSDGDGERALDSFLAGAQATGQAREAMLEGELDDLRRARTALLRRIRAAITELGAARAAVIRKPVSKLQKELDAHKAERQRLLNALQDFTQERYWPQERPFGLSGYDARGVEISFTPTETLPTPIWMQWQEKIDAIEAEAARVEQFATAAVNGGHLQAVEIADLLKLGDDVERIAPLRRAIEAWVTSAIPRAKAGLEMRMVGCNWPPPDIQTIQFVLSWDADGNIDEPNSQATIFGEYSPRVAATVAV